MRQLTLYHSLPLNDQLFLIGTSCIVPNLERPLSRSGLQQDGNSTNTYMGTIETIFLSQRTWSYLEKGRKRSRGKDDWKNWQSMGKFGKICQSPDPLSEVLSAGTRCFSFTNKNVPVCTEWHLRTNKIGWYLYKELYQLNKTQPVMTLSSRACENSSYHDTVLHGLIFMHLRPLMSVFK